MTCDPLDDDDPVQQEINAVMAPFWRWLREVGLGG